MNIAIVKLSAMGDIVHAMVALQYIKRSIPDIHIDWIVEEGFAALLEHNPHIDRVLPVNLKKLKENRSLLIDEIRLVKTYAEYEYDLVIDMQGLVKSAVVSRLLGHSVGFDRSSTREKAASFIYKQSFAIPYEENVIYRNVKLACMALDIDFEKKLLSKKDPFLFFTEHESRKTVGYLTKSKKNIVYIVGSSWESKIYPKEKFVEVINILGKNALLVWGDHGEYNDARYISTHTKAVTLPKLTLGELKALISGTDLVIGGDSGPTHFAWALNRPSITLFGPTPGDRNTFETTYNRVICSSSEVDPLRLDREDFSIQEIDPSVIVDTALDILNSFTIGDEEYHL